MEKKEYLESNINKLTQFWAGVAAFLGALVISALSLMDYYVVPEKFEKFLTFRIICAVLLFIIFYLNRLKISKEYQYSLILIGTILPSAMIELMILSTGGHASPYYAGMNLTIIFILGFIPISLHLSVSVVFIVSLIYILPLLFFDTIVDLQLFITNLAFFFSTSCIAFAWRYINQKNLINAYNLEYELARDKEKLEMYSLQLEDLVLERTKELTASETRYRELFENANDGIVVFDKDRIIQNVNQRYCEIHGFTKKNLMGKDIRILSIGENLHDQEKRIIRILDGEALVFETVHNRKDGSKVLLEISSKAIQIGNELFVQSFHRDITEKKRLQEQLLQSQKMESIGVLAGGVAHDFNSILSAILGHAELLREFENLEPEASYRVKVIEKSARKAGQLVSKLLSFARKGSFEILPLNLNDVIRDTGELLDKAMVKKKIALKMELDNSIPTVNGDSNQLEQVIMNLILNAADAMPEGGIITISTVSVNLESGASYIHPLLAPGKYVILKIFDEGSGIPEEIREKIFDPFFTTKEPGKGTGLGLAMVYGIVKDHKGVINVISHLGKGTTFEIYLPASDSFSLTSETLKQIRNIL